MWISSQHNKTFGKTKFNDLRRLAITFQYDQDKVQTTNNNVNEALGRVSSLTRALYATPERWTRYKERVEADEKSGWLRVVYIIGSESYSGKKSLTF